MPESFVGDPDGAYVAVSSSDGKFGDTPSVGLSGDGSSVFSSAGTGAVGAVVGAITGAFVGTTVGVSVIETVGAGVSNSATRTPKMDPCSFATKRRFPFFEIIMSADTPGHVMSEFSSQ